MTDELTLDVTDRIERMKALEDRCGITLEALYAVFVKDDYRRGVQVNFDVVAPSIRSLQIVVSVYNRRGQLVSTAPAAVLNEDSFAGFESCSTTLDCEEPPSRIRIYPQEF
ncbi:MULTISPECIES: hypothetical protein [Rhodococcus]|uniref:hypothetical protein n=1 Tax=Rhodococcus TaxID=1827 RepID=UPI00193B4554|nr:MULTISPECIES: hypothetical protein [Rhodococcus]QRI75039.1 hypothetical protein JQ505_21175 [Rhodococcus aetherivorans]QSE58448.1 hypothetical protein JYA75_22280 [Rhodococcus sp. PSBB066]QSE70231.1 hypothetical protein JYA91_05350 [Rhodococcus sp. PSBB049]